jgi:hypothetical protein
MTRNNADFHTRMVPMEETADWLAEDMHPLTSMTRDDLNALGKRNGEYNWSELHDSIAKDGITEPLDVHVDEEGTKTLMNGHHRYMVARDLGHSHVPVRFTHD